MLFKAFSHCITPGQVSEDTEAVECLFQEENAKHQVAKVIFNRFFDIYRLVSIEISSYCDRFIFLLPINTEKGPFSGPFGTDAL